jgi:hypothetical protein
MTLTPDAQLAKFWDAYESSGRPGPLFLLRRPGHTRDAVRALRALPTIPAQPSQAAGGRAIASTLRARGPLGVPVRWMGTAALPIPADPDAYLQGRQAQTLRRKIRAAERAGTRIEAVISTEARRELLALANQHERQHPDLVYRVSEPDNEDLLDHDLWLVARDADGEALLLSVTPIDGELATLRYFRTLGHGPAHSDGRYLATAALVETLSRRGVRWLLDTEPPGSQTNGLRQFQRMVGFGYVRFRLAR